MQGLLLKKLLESQDGNSWAFTHVQSLSEDGSPVHRFHHPPSMKLALNRVLLSLRICRYICHTVPHYNQNHICADASWAMEHPPWPVDLKAATLSEMSMQLDVSSIKSFWLNLWSCGARSWLWCCPCLGRSLLIVQSRTSPLIQRHMSNLLTPMALKLRTLQVRLTVTAECTGCYE